MIDIKSLPKVPEDAVAELLNELLRLIPNDSTTLAKFVATGNSTYLSIPPTLKLVKVAANRIQDTELREMLEPCLNILTKDTGSDACEKIERAHDALLAFNFDNHFVDTQDSKDFDQVELSTDERSELQDLMAKARKLTSEASFLSGTHKRKMNYWISKVENELFKEVVGFQAFLAMAGEASGLVRKFGDDAKPLAEAIKTARTITEEKVDGYKQIPKEEAPKQIEDKTSGE
ncbi:hypothetical protein [Tateyamaria sp.]|uniref:hypothetical protein n=1 Tax=Tateyamaria sp. TaxID=1929288 RepID=UPI00329ED4B1